MNKNIIFGLLIGLFSITSTSSYAGHHKATMQYGGDWVDVVAVASDGFMRMSGVFRGTNKMVREDGEVIITNFTCPGWWDAANGGNGACNMKEAGSNDYWVLSWDCDPQGNCSGQVKGGTGRFSGASGSMTWVNNNGWGEGGGTFMTK